MSRFVRGGPRGLLVGLVLALFAHPAGAAASRAGPLGPDDLRWLDRITLGVDSSTVARYRALGRARFLEEQLQPGALAPPADVEGAIAELGIPSQPLEAVLARVEAENKRIQALPEEARREARQELDRAAAAAAADAARRHLLRALWSPAQLEEQMVWFWLNHFSVFQHKGNLRWTIADYEERALRPHALGRFRDLLLATVTHPAMLVYLDNAQSAAGKVNENYARELLELHTLGVDGGYAQRDVQELARVLTGVGVHVGPRPRLPPSLEGLYRSEHGFEFNPARHDFGEKVVLGTRIPGAGFPEVEQVVSVLARHPATARHLCRKLGAYWLGEEPPAGLVRAMVRAYARSDGDIAAVLRVVFGSRPFAETLGRAVKDPMHFVVSALRLAYDGKRPLNMAPVIRWLDALGQPLYGHVTPEGYSLAAAAWTSPGQLARRFEIAKTIGSGPAGLFDGADGAPAPAVGFPLLASRLYYEAVEPRLSARTLAAQQRAASQQEWNTFLLSSPEFMLH